MKYKSMLSKMGDVIRKHLHLDVPDIECLKHLHKTSFGKIGSFEFCILSEEYAYSQSPYVVNVEPEVLNTPLAINNANDLNLPFCGFVLKFPDDYKIQNKLVPPCLVTFSTVTRTHAFGYLPVAMALNAKTEIPKVEQFLSVIYKEIDMDVFARIRMNTDVLNKIIKVKNFNDWRELKKLLSSELDISSPFAGEDDLLYEYEFNFIILNVLAHMNSGGLRPTDDIHEYNLGLL